MTFEQTVEKNVKYIQDTLIARGQTVATAESCTAGLVAYGLTSLAGSSTYFKQGWVVYHTQSKQQELLLPPHVEVYSAECAKHLATAARYKANADYGIGVTGKADPYNGIVWFAIARPNEVYVKALVRKYQGDRNTIRVNAAVDIIKALKTAIK